MGSFAIFFLRLTVLFGKNAIGCINNPYITYRKLADEKTDSRQTVFVFIFALGYFIFASFLKTGLKNPFLLTLKFNSLILASISGFWGTLLFIFLFGQVVKKETNFKRIFILWSYSLIPTLIWFYTTSFLYLLFPPPRTLSLFGKIYSLVYITFSLALLFWKIILYYLTLRFALRLDLGKIIVASFFLIPFFSGYSILMYKLGIFRIPFI